MILLVIGVFVWGVISQNKQQSETNASAARAAAAKTDQELNTKRFLDHLSAISDEVSKLKTSIATQTLQNQLTSVTAELEKTRANLIGPAPINFIFSLSPMFSSDVGDVLTVNSEATLPQTADGYVHVPFYIFNPTDRAALNVELILTICNSCKFSKEPTGFSMVANDSEHVRHLTIPQILATTQVSDLSADIIPLRVA